MKDQSTKDRFILLRAEGKSFSAIAQELCISKSTCSEWEQELKAKIAELKADRMNELYEKYYMTRKARIEQTGTTLAKINTAIEQADLTEADPVRLMELTASRKVLFFPLSFFGVCLSSQLWCSFPFCVKGVSISCKKNCTADKH